MNAQEIAQYEDQRKRLDRIYADAAAVRDEFRDLVAQMAAVIASQQGAAS